MGWGGPAAAGMAERAVKGLRGFWGDFTPIWGNPSAWVAPAKGHGPCAGSGELNLDKVSGGRDKQRGASPREL